MQHYWIIFGKTIKKKKIETDGNNLKIYCIV